MIRFVNLFTKITAWLVQKICFRTKIYYEDKKSQNRRIKGKAILVSNHTSIYDYAVYLFVFFTRTLRYQMAEILFKKKFLGFYLKLMGGIKINRDTHDFSFMEKSEAILNKSGVVGVFPESRIPEAHEEKPLEFKPSVVVLALSSNAPIIPTYTNGSYFNKKRARVIIGKPIYLADMYDNNKTQKENIDFMTKKLRDKVIELKQILEEMVKNEK